MDRIEDVSREEWDALLARSFRPSPFFSPRFLVPWSKYFAADHTLRIARWEREGRADGLIFLSRCADCDGWELLGGEEVSDSMDAVVASGEEERFWTGFLRAAKGSLAPGPLRMPNLVEGTPTLSLLPGICGELGIGFIIEETDRSPYLALPGSFEDYVEGLGKKERHELRRKIRRTSESDPALSYRVTGTSGELALDFPAFVALHRASHPEKNRFMDGRMEKFFLEIAQEFFSVDGLRLAFLRGGKGDLAAAFQIEYGGVLYLYNSGFDPEAAAGTSPGLVLLSRCIEDAIGRGIREYDFLRGRERYKYDLGGRDRVVYRAVLRLP